MERAAAGLMRPRCGQRLTYPAPPHAHRTDPFLKKDWYEIKAPSMFTVRNVGKTLVTRTQGTKVCVCVVCVGGSRLHRRAACVCVRPQDQQRRSSEPAVVQPYGLAALAAGSPLCLRSYASGDRPSFSSQLLFSSGWCSTAAEGEGSGRRETHGSG